MEIVNRGQSQLKKAHGPQLARTGDARVSKTPTPYKKFASVYDQMGADEHSIKMTEYCRQIFRKFKIKPTVGLDLCCGTGTAIERFADRGILMSGLDGSTEMLVQAAKKLKGRGVPLYHKQLPKFSILDPNDSRKRRSFDLVTCFYDSLNYLTTKRDLKTAFRSVYQHLRPGGWFIFDMNTPEALKILWGGQIFADARDDMAWIWKNEYNPKTRSAKCTTTFFDKKGTTWERFVEEHVERGWDNDEIKKMLTDAGFVVKGFYRCHTFNRPTKNTYRICAVAQRPAK